MADSRPTRDLPAPATLKRIMQSLAMLDAIVEDDWASRYFSFDAHWSTNSQMGSMRNGQGDDLFAVFDAAGCFMRGFDHASAMSPWSAHPPRIWPGVLDHVPPQFAASLMEPAFHMADTTFCRWCLADDEEWRQGDIAYPAAIDPDGAVWMLSFYSGGPQAYRDFAAGYYGIDIDMDAIARVFDHQNLSLNLVQALGSQRSYAHIVAEAAGIGYPVG